MDRGKKSMAEEENREMPEVLHRFVALCLSLEEDHKEQEEQEQLKASSSLSSSKDKAKKQMEEGEVDDDDDDGDDSEEEEEEEGDGDDDDDDDDGDDSEEEEEEEEGDGDDDDDDDGDDSEEEDDSDDSEEEEDDDSDEDDDDSDDNEEEDDDSDGDGNEEEEDHEEQEQQQHRPQLAYNDDKAEDDDNDDNEEDEEKAHEEQEQPRGRLRPYDENDFIPYELFSVNRYWPSMDLISSVVFSSSETATPNHPPQPPAPSSRYPAPRPFPSLPSHTGFSERSVFLPATMDGAGPSNSSPHQCRICCGSVERERRERYGVRVVSPATTNEGEEAVEAIMVDVIHDPWSIMEHHEGTRLFQRLVDLCTPWRRMALIWIVVSQPGRLFQACCNQHGARAMQHLISSCTEENEFYMLHRAFNDKSRLIPLCFHSSGHFVVIRLLDQLPSQFKMNALLLINLNFRELATNQYGCMVLHKSVEYFEDQPDAWIFYSIEMHALVLAQDDYSNYLVQKAVQVIEFMASRIIRKLSGNFILLSIQKCSSNVVETCIRMSNPEEFANIIIELFSSSRILDVVEDPYGNYVIQRAIDRAKGRDFQIMDEIISENETRLSRNIYARNVLRTLAVRRKALGKDEMKIARVFDRKY